MKADKVSFYEWQKEFSSEVVLVNLLGSQRQKWHFSFALI